GWWWPNRTAGSPTTGCCPTPSTPPPTRSPTSLPGRGPTPPSGVSADMSEPTISTVRTVPGVAAVPVVPALARRLVAEFAGTGLLVTAVVGSGIMTTGLSPQDVGLQLLENSTAMVFALAALILIFGPVSGAQFNPVVTLADWWLGRRAGTGLRAGEVVPYLLAQTAGAIAGSILANLMFALPAVHLSTQQVPTALLPGPIGD